MGIRVEIGRQYQDTLKEAIALYRHGFFEEETKLIEQVNGLFYPINCYSNICLKRIEEKHILIKKDGEKLRFHTRCIDGLANSK